ncbi:MAG: hypothetical protein ACW99A_13090 [Candidatus Kariarchaeaceae archaeon]|jgi:hypothetical protein
MTAIVDPQDIILIWKQHEDTVPPAGENGSLVSIIINQFKEIRKIAWVIGEETLVIKEENKITLWDPLNNKLVFSINTSEELYFVKKIEDKYIMCTPSGRLILFNEHMMEIQPSKGELIWITESSIIIYPYEYLFDDGQFIRQTIEDNRTDRRLRRYIRNANSLRFENIFGNQIRDIVQRDLEIPEQYLYRFDIEDDIYVHVVQNGSLIKSEKYAIFIHDETVSISLLAESKCVVFSENSDLGYVHFISPNNEYLIQRKNEKITQKTLIEIIKEQDLSLQNLNPSLLIPFNISPKYTHINLQYGLMWVPDFYSSHILYDLLTNIPYHVENTRRSKFVNIFVDGEIEYILEWEKGMGYPEGQLKYYSLNEAGKRDLIYNFQKSDLDIESTNVIDEDGNTQIQIVKKNPIIVPAWNKIDLFVFYKAKQFESQISLSAFYMILEKWISLPSIEDLKISDKNPRGYAFVKYGDLSIDFENKVYHFEGVSPMWDYRPDLGLLAFSSYDENLYLWDLRQYLPIQSYKVGLPYLVEISPSGKYLLSISFGMSELTIKTEDINGQIITEYPRITLTILDTKNGKKFSRSYKFPTHLISPKITTNMHNEENEIVIRFPSYITKGRLVKVTFNTRSKIFDYLSTTPNLTFEDTHSYQGPNSQIKDGVEFPVEEHPEIKREYQTHLSVIHDFTMYRKSDSIVVASVLKNTQVTEQLSTDDVFYHQKKIMLNLPFYGDKNRPVYIDSIHKNKLREPKLIKLDKIKNLPISHIQSLTYKNRNIAYLSRLAEFLKHILTSNQVHNSDGISFYSEDVKNFQSEVTKIYNTISTKLRKNIIDNI